MSYYASKEQVLRASEVIGGLVDSRETVPFVYENGEFDVTHIPVETPAVIGSKLAVSLKLAKARKGELKAMAIYYDSPQGEGVPLRCVMLPKDGEAYGVFDGTFDAKQYRLPASYITALEADLTPALPQTK